MSALTRAWEWICDGGWKWLALGAAVLLTGGLAALFLGRPRADEIIQHKQQEAARDEGKAEVWGAVAAAAGQAAQERIADAGQHEAAAGQHEARAVGAAARVEARAAEAPARVERSAGLTAEEIVADLRGK